ncbi:MAG: hypothetical protein HFG41_03810 [Coprococcus sp.]|nr:hypothetical protein [Coprococcus sp.]
MYLKIIGCVLIVLASSGYGYAKGLEYKKQVEELEYVSRLLRQVGGEISYLKAPLPDVLKRVGRRVKNPYQSWLFSLSDALGRKGDAVLGDVWRTKTEEELKGVFLCKEELEELKGLGGQMGHLDIRMQEQTLSWYAKRLEEKGQCLRTELAQKRRLCNLLGVMGGVFLAIILI